MYELLTHILQEPVFNSKEYFELWKFFLTVWEVGYFNGRNYYKNFEEFLKNSKFSCFIRYKYLKNFSDNLYLLKITIFFSIFSKNKRKQLPFFVIASKMGKKIMLLYYPNEGLLEKLPLFLWFRQLSSSFFMSGSSHIQNVLIGVKCWNCCQTLDVYLLFAILFGQIKSKLNYRLVTYKLASP